MMTDIYMCTLQQEPIVLGAKNMMQKIGFKQSKLFWNNNFIIINIKNEIK